MELLNRFQNSTLKIFWFTKRECALIGVAVYSYYVVVQKKWVLVSIGFSSCSNNNVFFHFFPLYIMIFQYEDCDEIVALNLIYENTSGICHPLCCSHFLCNGIKHNYLVINNTGCPCSSQTLFSVVHSI